MYCFTIFQNDNSQIFIDLWNFRPLADPTIRLDFRFLRIINNVLYPLNFNFCSISSFPCIIKIFRSFYLSNSILILFFLQYSSLIRQNYMIILVHILKVLKLYSIRLVLINRMLHIFTSLNDWF